MHFMYSKIKCNCDYFLIEFSFSSLIDDLQVTTTVCLLYEPANMNHIHNSLWYPVVHLFHKHYQTNSRSYTWLLFSSMLTKLSKTESQFYKRRHWIILLLLPIIPVDLSKSQCPEVWIQQSFELLRWGTQFWGLL